MPPEVAKNLCEGFAGNHPEAKRAEFIKNCMSTLTIDKPATTAAAPSVSNRALACSPSNIEVKLVKFTDAEGRHLYMRVVGEIINHCSTPTGVQVRFVAKDAKDNLVAVRELWPASIRNIPANGRNPFDLTVFAYDRAIKRVEAEVIEVKQW